MIQIIKKSEQFNDIIFGGKFFANKPVFHGKNNVKPYSYLYYWSNSYVIDDCEFGLHPHEGFEIMTFLFNGKIEHYDTQSKVWTSLNAGDFQIIQSNSGIKHQERIANGSRAFQIWFDPNYKKTLLLNPSYIDYHSNDFLSREVNGVDTITYIGEGSIARTLTPDLVIKKIKVAKNTIHKLILDESLGYIFYVISGSGSINNEFLEIDDSLRVFNESELSLSFEGELFYIASPMNLSYKPIWEE